MPHAQHRDRLTRKGAKRADVLRDDGPISYTRDGGCPLACPSGCATVASMRQDPAFKDIFAYGFMVEELMRWFVGDLHGGRELVAALDFSLLLRVQEQSTTGRAGDKRSYANDIVWRVPFRGRRRTAGTAPGCIWC